MSTMTPGRRRGSASPAALALALEYVQSLARRGSSPLHAVLRGRLEPIAQEQYPRPGINWIGDDELGYFYHTHGPARQRRIGHGHFHLFARVPRRQDEAHCAPYVHLIGIDVDATGKPLRLFTTNLWVTAGVLRPQRFVRQELLRFAELGRRMEGGPERWIGLILGLYPWQVADVLRSRDARLESWRRQGVEARRLADRRIRLLSSLALPFGRMRAS